MGPVLSFLKDAAGKQTCAIKKCVQTCPEWLRVIVHHLNSTKRAGEGGTMLLPQELLQNMQLLDRNTQNY